MVRGRSSTVPVHDAGADYKEVSTVHFMDIHFVSTLTPEDEDMYAPTVLNAVRAILDAMPIAYTLRIETASTGCISIRSRTWRLCAAVPLRNWTRIPPRSSQAAWPSP